MESENKAEFRNPKPAERPDPISLPDLPTRANGKLERPQLASRPIPVSGELAPSEFAGRRQRTREKPWMTDDNIPVEIERLVDNRQRRVCKVLAIRCSLSEALKIAGVSLQQHKKWLDQSQDYSEAFTIAENHAALMLEQIAIKRARDGVKSLKIWRGQPVLARKHPELPESPDNPLEPVYDIEYSDQLLLTLLKGKNPQYRNLDSPVNVSATQINQNGTMEPAQWLRDLVQKD
jgi:hypothetical protein